ncbi:MAG TPA: hypothetical protein DD435_13980 [Cyanobacteria bacterium UBA8530]|nr:hypothetical protein [Cyanobacteria bacterium UBA8530]
MAWTDFERFLLDLTTLSLAIAFFLHGLSLRFALRSFAQTSMAIAWLSSGILLVGHLATTGRFSVWWMAVWWLILWYWSLEIPLSTRTLGLPASLLGLLYLGLKSSALPFGWHLATAAFLLMGMVLLDFAFASAMLFFFTGQGTFRRTSQPWLSPELVQFLMKWLSSASIPFLLFSLLAQIGAFDPFAHLFVSIALICATAAALKRGNPWLLGLSALACAAAASAMGLFRF